MDADPSPIALHGIGVRISDTVIGDSEAPSPAG